MKGAISVESKIEVTRRLQLDGRWGTAAAAKDAEKQRLLDSGLTRREANLQAWHWMIENYPPQSSSDVAWNRSLSQTTFTDFPDHLGLDSNNEGYRFNDLWWAFRYLVARDICLQENDFNGMVQIEQRMLDACDSTDRTALSTMAIACPETILELCEVRFETALFQLIDLGSAHTPYIDALAQYYEDIASMSTRSAEVQLNEHAVGSISEKYRQLFYA